jgi:dinuclear metal center YbgI/SA1388 family protein
MKISDVVNYFEEIAPQSFQESYDNAGLIVGNGNAEVKGILISLDVTEEVVQDAIEQGANFIVAHHPIVFSGLKRFNGNNYVERTVIMALKNDVAIFAAHTNIDSVIYNGVNSKICEKLELENTKILKSVKNELKKLIEHVNKVRNAMFDAGAGVIGNYNSCSFNTMGSGTFKAGEGTDPFVGKVGELHSEEEVRVETIVPAYKTNKVISKMVDAHPYEEVPYDLYPLENSWSQVGMGMVGSLKKPMDEMDFLIKIKKIFNVGSLKYTQLKGKKINKVAVCGGSGSFLLKNAILSGADVFISGDFKYHQFFDAEGRIIIADIGHFESEQFTKELFYELLTRKFSNFAIHFTKINTNPIKYI